MSESDTAAHADSAPHVVTSDRLHALMQLLAETQEDQYSCQETFDLLDQYVELVRGREQADLLMPLVKKHLDNCPGCHEEYDVLIRILEAESTRKA